MQISANKVVLFDFTLKNDDGEVLGTSVGGEPLAYLHGAGEIVPGLELALAGKFANDEFRVRISACDGFGERDEGLVQIVPREQFRDFPDLCQGMEFELPNQDGEAIVTVAEVKDDFVTLDGNHELSGMVLHFDVVVREVREATSQELAHGHAHGVGGHNH